VELEARSSLRHMKPGQGEKVENEGGDDIIKVVRSLNTVLIVRIASIVLVIPIELIMLVVLTWDSPAAFLVLPADFLGGMISVVRSVGVDGKGEAEAEAQAAALGCSIQATRWVGRMRVRHDWREDQEEKKR
jgi:hypothetical protein